MCVFWLTNLKLTMLADHRNSHPLLEELQKDQYQQFHNIVCLEEYTMKIFPLSKVFKGLMIFKVSKMYVGNYLTCPFAFIILWGILDYLHNSQINSCISCDMFQPPLYCFKTFRQYPMISY